MNVEVSNHMQALEEEQIKALDKNLKPLKRKTLINKILKNNHQKSNNKQKF